MFYLLKRFHSTSARSSLSPQGENVVSKAFNQLPWNFNAHLINREVCSLDAPVDLGSQIFNSVQATTVFKELVAGVQEGDLSFIEDRMEPTMYRRAQQKVVDAHSVLNKNNLMIKSQNIKNGHNTSFFLYNV